MSVTVREKPPGSGVWWLFINHHGKRTSKRVGDEKTALEAAKKITAKLVLGDLDIGGPEKDVPTFKQYSELYLAYIKIHRRYSTWERYDQVLRQHILPVFGKMRLDEITRGDIRNFIVEKSQGYTPFIFRDVLSGVFSYALDDEVIKANPVTGITKRLKIKRDRSEVVDPLNEADISLFLETCKAHFNDFYPFFLTAARTGMRLGELLALQWGDLDFSHRIITKEGEAEERPFIWVKRSYRRGKLTKPKNGKIRQVDMSMELKAVLLDHRTREKKTALKSGSGELPKLVFNNQGEPFEQNYVRRVFKRILTKAGLRDVKLHGLRHSFASLLLSAGESPVYVKEMLGHSSIQITVDIYGKWIPSDRKTGVNTLDSTAPNCTLYAPTKKTKAVTS